MSEPEIIRLRKLIHSLKEANEKLKQDNENLSNALGKYQLEEYSKRNKQEILAQETIIAENKLKMKE